MRVLGIDGGIASVGWAVIDIDPDARIGKIVDAGTWMFESPEEATQTGPKLKNADRRMYRGQRRVVRRRGQRMKHIRKLFHDAGLIDKSDRDALRGDGLDPWQLRAEGLVRALTPREWAIALGHIAKHRGFRSNKKNKGARPNKASDNSKMLSAIEETKERLARYETVGQMFARDAEFAGRKRNRGGLFTRSILRDDQEAEVRKLFAAQRRLGNEATGDEFQAEFIHAAFWQRPLQSSEEMVGFCTFETGERRTARFAPGFEKFRLYSRLAALRLQTGRTEQALTAGQIAGFPKDYGSTAALSYTALRKHLDLDPNTRFAGVSREDEKKIKDFVARSGSALNGTAKFRKVLEPAIGALETRKLIADSLLLDRAAEIITFNEDGDEIRKRLVDTGLSEAAQMAINDAVERGDFDEFKGAGHISAKAAAKIVPGLMRGLRYDEACQEVYGHHSDSAVNSITDISSPVARKALGEMLKQIRILEREYGLGKDATGRGKFDRIHVEMARDVGKGIEERGKIERGIEKRNVEKDRLRDDLKRLLGVERVGPEDLLRYELWREQNGRSIYTNDAIPADAILSADNRVQVDHILPWSRFGDDSYHNKTLCFVKENADKQGRTPFEWLGGDAARWDGFTACVEGATSLRGYKKRNYMLRNAEEVQNKFRERNLNDTRYALRALLAELGRRYPPLAGKRRVYARPGELTSKLRQAWGIESLKKGPDGARLADDRHHALDAIVTAVITESLLQRATKASQHAEKTGDEFHLRGLEEPWPGFRDDAKAAFGKVFVARQVVRRERGKAHDATIKQIREVDGEKIVYERKAVEKLKLTDLALIPIPEPYGTIADPKRLRDEMVESLRAYIIERDANKGKAEPPRSPKGDVIRKVRVRSNSKPAVLVRGGTADRVDMVRVDVFTRPNKKGEKQFFLVPVYLHEVATRETPPMRAVQAYADELDWPIMGSDFNFEFSQYPMSLIKVTAKTTEPMVGYYRGLDRSTGAIIISKDFDSQSIIRGIGARTLKSFKKLQVDRLGRVTEVQREVRLWRGKAYTSPDPQGSVSPTGN